MMDTDNFVPQDVSCTAIHKCVCGCGNEVITPISPTDWRLLFYGDAVSLSPSIGNWYFNCKSHYWITKNKIIHARRWSDKEIKQGGREDTINKTKYFSKKRQNLT